MFGSYPPVHLSDEPRDELATLVESYIVRDASDRFRIRRIAALRKILELAASRVGNLCNFSDWGALAGISYDTVAEYCRILGPGKEGLGQESEPQVKAVGAL